MLMKKPHVGFIKTYKLDSVFSKTFFALVIMSLLLMAMVYYFAITLISDNLRQRTYASNMDMLGKTSSALDLTFSSIGQAMYEALWDHDVIGVVISPKLSSYIRKASVVKKLNNLVENNKYISSAYLYVPKADTIYTSSGNIMNYANFNDKSAINSYREGIAGSSRIVDANFTTSVRVVDGCVLLFQEFPTPEKNAVLIVELKSSALYKAVNRPGNNADRNIYVFSDSKYPIFKNEMDYTPVTSILLPGTEVFLNEKNTSLNRVNLSAAMGNSFLSFKSPTTGWELVYPFDSRAIQLDFRSTIPIILPFLIVFLLVSLLYSLYITYNNYKPINELMSWVTGSMKRIKSPQVRGDIKNEFDFLKNAFSNAVDRTDHLTEMMETVRPAIKDKLIKNLLLGKELSPTYIEENTKILGGPDFLNKRYMVLITALKTLAQKKASDVEINLFNISIKKIVSSLMQDTCDCDSVITEDGKQVFIMGFSSETSIIQIKQFIINLCDGIEAEVSNLPFSIIIGRGKVCNGILDIQYSYADAREDLNYRIYLGEDTTLGFVDISEMEVTDTQYDSLYFNGRYKQIILAVAEGNREKAAAILEQITGEIAENAPEPETARGLFESLMDTLIEKMVSMRINNEEMLFAEKKFLNGDFSSFTDVSHMQQFTLSFCNRSIELIDTYNRKSGNKYIERAKEYIANNFTDSDLSLSIVGEHIGINPGYLSRLFYDHLNQRFVDYINQYRVDKSKQLLQMTNLTITEIGYKAGFNSIQNFIRVFRKHTGLTPGQFRDKMY